MQRETKTFTTPSGIVFEIKTYLTGREKRDLTNVYLTSDLNVDVETKSVKGISAKTMDAGQDLAFKIVIVSINEQKDSDTFSVVDFVLDLKAEEFDFVVSQINAVTNDKAFAEKKTI